MSVYTHFSHYKSPSIKTTAHSAQFSLWLYAAIVRRKLDNANTKQFPQLYYTPLTSQKNISLKQISKMKILLGTK